MKHFIRYCVMIIVIISFNNTVVAQNYWRHSEMPYAEFIRSADSVNILGGSSGSIFKTVDGGQSWSNILSSEDIQGKRFDIRDLAFPVPNLIVGIADSGGSSQIIRSDDGGQTWTIKNFGLNGDIDARYFSKIVMNNANNGVILQRWQDTGRTDKLFSFLITSDGGLTWINAEDTDEDFVNSFFNSYAPYVQLISPKPGTWLVHDIFSKENILWRTSDFGRTFTKQNCPVDRLTRINFIDSVTGYAIGKQFASDVFLMAKTMDGGATWIMQELGIQHFHSRGLADLDFYDEKNGIIVTDWGALFRTQDGGITWNEEYTGLWDSVAAYASDLRGILYTSKNNALGFSILEMIKFIPEGIAEQPWMTFPSSVSGAGWIDEVPIPGEMLWRSVPEAKKYYIEIYKNDPSEVLFVDSSMTNSILIKDLPEPLVGQVRVRAVTSTALSNWSVPAFFRVVKTVSIKDNFEDLVLSPYPNPANNISYIPFKTTNESETSVMISDALGKSINNFKSSYSLSHNAIILSHLEQLSNGIYFVQISQGNHSQTSMITISK